MFEPSTQPLFWPIDWALPSGVHAMCTTRLGGVSRPPFDALNLGEHVQDDPAHVAHNRALLQSHMAGARPVFLSQVHGIQVVDIDSTTPHGITADASVTSSKQIACTIMVADCLPLLFTDHQGLVVAAAHAGWRGLAHGVIEQVVHALCQKARVLPTEVHAWLGPCIGPEAFEVGEEVRKAMLTFSNAQNVHGSFAKHPSRLDKWFVDLAGLARLRLHALGVRSVTGNNSTREWCTVSQASRLFSYRRDGVTGRFAACIWRS